MARLREVGPVLRRVGIFGFLKRVLHQISDDDTLTWGAALAYSWLFAIFPFLVFLLSLIPLVPQHLKANVQDNLEAFANKTLPPGAAEMVMTPVNSVLERQSAKGFFSFGLALTLLAASSGMNMTMVAIDKAYDVTKGRPLWKQRPLALVMTVVVAILVILVMILLPIGAGVVNWLVRRQAIIPWLGVLVDVVRYVIAMMLLFTLLAIIYYFAPNFKQRFVPVTPGAIFCVTVWLVLGLTFRMYLTRLGGSASYNKTYGAIAGAAILLLFFYIDALVLLIGAEINSEIDYEMGNLPHRQLPPSQADDASVAMPVRQPADSVQPPQGRANEG